MNKVQTMNESGVMVKVEIRCGISPYLMGQKLTCRGYKVLAAEGFVMTDEGQGMLELRQGEKWALIGMTPALRRKLGKAKE